MSKLNLADYIRDIPDFPKPGILFRDITPLLKDPAAFSHALAQLEEAARDLRPDLIAGIESRGFLFGTPLASRLGIPFVPVRKPGKLPAETVSESYTLEYGEDALEMHRDAARAGQRVLVVDDLLATGGTAAATVRLLQKMDAQVAGLLFVIELGFLKGRKLLEDVEVRSLLSYD